MNRFSFYRRIQLSFFFFILLPFIFVTLWSYTSVKENVTDKISRSNEDVLTVISDAISKTVDSISFASVYFSQSYDTNVTESLRYLKDVTNFSGSEVYTKQKQLQGMVNILSIQSVNSELKLFVLNSRQRLLAGNLELPIFSEIADPGFQAYTGKLDRSEHTTLQWFRLPGTDESPAYYYAAKIILDHRNQKPLATLYIGIPETYFDTLFNLSGRAGSLKLVDRSGEWIAGAGEDPPPSKDTLTSRRVIPQTGWTLLYSSPKSEVTGQINREFLLTLAVTGGFFVVFLLVSLFWAKRLIKPILQLRGKAKLYVAGSRNVRMPVKGKDEVALLSSVFNQMLDDIDQLLHRMERDQEEKRELELRALAAQIRPHFLLNTLNSIKVNLIMAGDSVHSATIESLMTLMRAYIRPDEPVGLAEEQRLLESYVRVMRLRNRMEIAFRCDLAEETRTLMLPRMLLQPIVENAIIHGFAAHPDEAEIRMTALRCGDMLEITIEDNGRGMPPDRLEALNRRLDGTGPEDSRSSGGVGLVNTVKRLHHYYGPRVRLRADNAAPGGLKFVMSIPYDKLAQKEDKPDVHRNAD